MTCPSENRLRSHCIAWPNDTPTSHTAATLSLDSSHDADAGLTAREVVQTIHQRGGYYMGLLKSNRPSLQEAVALWIEVHWQQGEGHPEADGVHWGKGHGRLECRSLISYAFHFFPRFLTHHNTGENCVAQMMR